MRPTIVDQQHIERVGVRLREVVQEPLKMRRVQRGQPQEIRVPGARCNRAVQVKVAVGVLIGADGLRAAGGNTPPPDRVQAQAAFVHGPDDDRLCRTRRNDRLHPIAEGGAKGRDGLSVFFDAMDAAP